jgi:hypothetical protein
MDATEVGKYLFGRPARLKLCRWVLHHDKGRFFQSQPPADIGATSAVIAELSKLVRLGMLDRESPDGESRVYYVRTESPLWRIIETADEVVGG